MENVYGIKTNNRYDLFLDEDADPLDILRAQEEIAKKKAEEKKGQKHTKSAAREADKSGKLAKAKPAKNTILDNATENKPSQAKLIEVPSNKGGGSAS